MMVHIFGAVCSPSKCCSVLRKIAEDNAEEFADVAKFVHENFYVDNYLDSVPTVEEAIHRIRRLIGLLARGGFKLVQVLSSFREVMAAVKPEERIAPELDLFRDMLPTLKTMGLLWDSERDVFRFKIDTSRPVKSKRHVLKESAMVFDPLGILAPDIWR